MQFLSVSHVSGLFGEFFGNSNHKIWWQKGREYTGQSLEAVEKENTLCCFPASSWTSGCSSSGGGIGIQADIHTARVVDENEAVWDPVDECRKKGCSTQLNLSREIATYAGKACPMLQSLKKINLEISGDNFTKRSWEVNLEIVFSSHFSLFQNIKFSL
jgi:hypothetical protein